jgi:amphi-Trp domain-containing protein
MSPAVPVPRPPPARARSSEPVASLPDSPLTYLPSAFQQWPLPSFVLRMGRGLDPEEVSLEQVRRYASDKAWLWPSRLILFFCDIHADTDAFLLSLLASGGVMRTGSGDRDFRLSERGRSACFIIAGDCFDKGPENLRLLRCLRHLLDLGADVTILAGNHDLRTYLGLAYAGRRETRLQHLFVRMGKKTMPLFLEIRDAARRAGETDGDLLSDEEVRRRLFPSQDWYGDFEAAVGNSIPPKKLAKEVRRIREKAAELETTCRTLGVRLGEIYAALERARRMFLERDGEFAWYFQRMTLARQEGSFLFVHAGVDDTVARVLCRHGVRGLNAWYQRLFETDLFELYHGALGNTFRTKYRDIDYPLTEHGVSQLHGAGIYAIVHGHRNILHGQRLTLRQGVLNFECDASVDRNTRVLEHLAGPGGAVVLFLPTGRIQAISTDYPFIKDFDPARVFQFTSLTSRPNPREEHGIMTATNGEPNLEETVVIAADDADEDAEHEPSHKSKAKLKFASVMQRAEAVAYFSALVDGLRHGRLQFRHGKESVALEPSAQVAIEVKASRKGDRERVSFELEWKRLPRESLEVSG